MTILITGATGTVGRSLVSELTKAGAPIRALVRDPDRARAILPAAVDLVVGDFADGASLEASVHGVQQVFLAAPNHPEQVAWESAMIDAARAAGVARLVKLSAHGARRGSPVDFWDAHARIEEHLAESGLPSVVLRPTTYATNLLASLESVKAGLLVAPAAGALIAFIDPADVAAAAAAALLRPSWTGQTITLTGPEPIGFERAAEVFAELLDRPVAFVPVSDVAALAALVGSGAPPWFAENLVRVFAALREGLADITTPAVLDLTGRPPMSLRAALAQRLAQLRVVGAAG